MDEDFWGEPARRYRRPGRRAAAGGVGAALAIAVLAGGSALASGPDPSRAEGPAPVETITLEPRVAGVDERAGLAILNTELGYQRAEAAGTGIVLTSDGVVLTNTHVIAGSTEVSVTVGTPPETYAATVVGSDSANDVAVLQLDDAANLAIATVDKDEDLDVGDEVTVVGNAQGASELMATPGMVTSLDRSITTRTEGSTTGRELGGLIEVDADVVSGDSGGAILDADGEVVGMTTAASTGREDIRGYAIPAATVLDIAAQILSGEESETVSIGYPAFLGVQLVMADGADRPGGLEEDGGRGDDLLRRRSESVGAPVAGVISGTPADEAGLVAGDVVTSLDGTEVTSPADLTARLAELEPGDTVTIEWTSRGVQRTADVTLVEGPAG
ncbi:S1C family serine protease [Cellulomonas chengniuliangii]|uniref:S1C family serine protease n=1 Tax=Cellulomonas chengniuliangii TaxID=2968084 RepID=A0ABY5KYK9_9CELL|nr:trypsin-like peptidase domain-containing protein [Cellulomonas chengniuliangii]MCC2308914.1 S1C family serine protease [Cellulomonas chengniuliangii]UUI74347.1 S1C family serine protease [Cellulomonas chengniuliangii]